MNDVPIITIDGPSGTGKGTLCHRLAQYLGWHSLDSGAIYRVLALAATRAHVRADQVDDLVQLALHLPLRFSRSGESQTLVYLGDEDISAPIRTESCGQLASQIAQIPRVRVALLERQRAFAQTPGLVADGRDLGTVVFPEAALKIYLDASEEIRAKRRYEQLNKSEKHVSLAQVVDELQKRDARDRSRTHAPLVAAHDAIHVDTTGLRIDEVFQHILHIVSQRLGS